MNYIAAMDTETGGLDPNKTDLLTFYMAILDENYKLVDEIDLKLKPEGRPPVAEKGALDVNGIDIVKHIENPETITYSEAKDRVIAMLKKYVKKRGRSTNIRPLGHNLQFDLDYTWKHLIDKTTWESLISYRVIDTSTINNFLKDSGWFPGELGNLGSLVDYFKIPKRTAHAAKDDTLMTIEVYKKMLELMASKKDGGQQQDLISLLESE